MKKLTNILFSTLLSLSCFNNIAEKEIIRPDDENIYKSAFPDPFYRDLIEEQLWYLVDSSKVKKYILLKYFDSNVDDIPDLAVGYYLKKFDEENGKYEIDSLKAPPIVLKSRNLYIYQKMYFYNNDTEMYERYISLRDLLR